MEITLTSIGTVRSPIKERQRGNIEGVIAEINIDDNFAEGLDNIDEFSHLIIIYYLHQSRRPFPLKVRPKWRTEPAPVGVFSSRSPDRPNPLAKTVVKLLERRGNVLKVQGLDAIDGTPVIDIKPYLPDIDSVPDARVPRWITKP